ncbi:MAG TPA: Ig-like domain-containing protein, partial [Tepidisphaeraceae bacterium]|nr:Ig-like domain-containing protein [Tepidisphaeraceae bacterium]
VGYDQFGDAMAVQPAFAWSVDGGGVGSVDGAGAYTAGAAAGSATVRATSGGVSGTATVTVTNAAPTVATPAAAAPPVVTATTSALSVLGADDGGEANLTYTWAATTKPAGSNPVFAANGTNGAKGSTVTFDRAGSYTFTVTISDGSLTTTSTVSVTVGQTLTTIGVTPASVGVNLNGSRGFAAVGYDQFSQPMAAQPSFAWTIDGGGVGSIDSSGTYTAGAVTGSATIRATSGAVSGTASITVTNAGPTVATPASAAPSPVTVTYTDLSVAGGDDGGEAGLTYTWSVTTKPSGALNPTFSANGTNAAKDTRLTFSKAGTYVLQVVISDGAAFTSSSVSVTVNQTLTTIGVSPASAGVNLNGMQALAAVAYDQFGAAMAVQPAFTWSVDGGGVGSVDGSGTYTAGPTAGSATVRATSGGVSGTATIMVTNAAPTIATPAAAAPSTVTTAVTSLSVLGADDNGEPNLTYTWSVMSKPAGAADPTFSANGTNAAQGTTATFARAGTYTFLVTISDGSLSATSSVSVTVAQTLATVGVMPGVAGVNLNGTRAFAAVGYDQFGDAMAVQPAFAWSVDGGGVGSVDGSGAYTAGSTPGSATVRATSGGVSGAATVTVTNAAPTVATPAAAAPPVVTATTSALSVLGADDGGEGNLTYTWAATTKPAGSSPTFSANGTNAAQSSTVTFDKAGSYTFTVTISDGSLTATSTVSVTVAQTLTTIAVTPGTAFLNFNGTTSFAAVGYDQFGDLMAAQPAFAWSVDGGGVGSVDAAGTYLAGLVAGTATLRATVGGGASGTASVTVANAAPSLAALPAASPPIVFRTGTTLSVLGADDAGEAGLTYTWAVTAAPAGAGPTFSGNGTNAAKSVAVSLDRAGSYTFLVTVSDAGGGAATGTVAVVVDQALSTLVVSPAVATTHASPVVFMAAGLDQFGHALVALPPIAWSVVSGGGDVDASGRYTPGTVVGPAVVRATAGGVSADAVVTVTNAVPTATGDAGATNQGTTLVIPAVRGVLANDGDADGDLLTAALLTGPAHGTLTLNADGSFAYMPAAGYAGADRFTYRAYDGFVWSAPATVTLTVLPTRPDPVTPDVPVPPPLPPLPPTPLPIDPGPTDVVVTPPPGTGGWSQGTFGNDVVIDGGASGGNTSTTDGGGTRTDEPIIAPPDEAIVPPADETDTPEAAPDPAAPDEGDGRGEEGVDAPADPVAATPESLPTEGDESIIAARHAAAVATRVAEAYAAAARDPEAAVAVAQAVAHAQQDAVAVRTAAAVSAGVTSAVAAGYLVWLVQGGSLLASLFAAMPFWRWFDPLPIVDAWDKASATASGRRRWWRLWRRGGGGSAPTVPEEQRIEELLR